MNDWLTRLTIGEIIAALTVLLATGALVLRLWRPIRRVLKSLETIGSDWNGTPERRDGSGEIIDPGRPGVMVQLETLRAQVQNSHDTNLRDDVDGLAGGLEALQEALAEHIKIAKQSDRQQAALAQKVDDLHTRYTGNRSPADG